MYCLSRARRTRAIFATFLTISFVYMAAHLRPKSVTNWPTQVSSISDIQTKPNVQPPACRSQAPHAPLHAPAGYKIWKELATIYHYNPPCLPYQDSNINGLPPSFLLPTSPLSASQLRSTHATVKSSLPEYPTDKFSGNGIVILVGGPRDEFAATALGMLKLYGTTLPVELWFTEDKYYDKRNMNWCAELLRLGFDVACRSLGNYMDTPEQNWIGSRLQTRKRELPGLAGDDQAVFAAVLFSSFRHVMYLSPETLPTMNIDTIFEASAYQSKGAILWKDFWETNWGKWGRYVAGVGDEAVERGGDTGGQLGTERGLDEKEKATVDKGVFMIDKQKHWKALGLSLYYTAYPTFFASLLSAEAPNDRLVGSALHTALMALRLPYHFVPASPEQIPRADAAGEPWGSGVCVLFHNPSFDSEDEKDEGENGSEMAFLKTSIVRFGVRDLMCDKSCVDSERVNVTIQNPSPSNLLLGFLSKLMPSNRAQKQRQEPFQQLMTIPHPRPLARQRMIGTWVRTMGAVATRSDPLFPALNQTRLLLSKKILAEKGGPELQDLEEEIWLVLERIACEGDGLGAVVDGIGGGEALSEEELYGGNGLCRNVRRYIEKAVGEKKRGWWRGCADGEVVPTPAAKVAEKQ